MGCWSCGSEAGGFFFECAACATLKDIKTNTRDLAEVARHQLGVELDRLEVEREGFETVQRKLGELGGEIRQSASLIVSRLEWGFEETHWQLHQQTDTLRKIEDTLATPAETQANEYRRMAEELKRRGVLDETKDHFIKALDLNRLDYQTYIGLAQVYIQTNNPTKALSILEKSLSHAPRGEIDYKSYSYRLIGHIHECEGDYDKAKKALNSAVLLSPTWIPAHYSYAQYCARTGCVDDSLTSLKKAILADPKYFYLAQWGKNFEPIRQNVLRLLIDTALKETLSLDYYGNIFELAKHCALLGHLEDCVSVLHSLLDKKDLPLNYYDSIFELSKRCASLKNPEGCVSLLCKLIINSKEHKYYDLILGESCFKLILPIFVKRASEKAGSDARDSVCMAGDVLSKAEGILFGIRTAMTREEYYSEEFANISRLYEEAKWHLNTAKDKLTSKEYKELCQAKQHADESLGKATIVLNWANDMRAQYESVEILGYLHSEIRFPDHLKYKIRYDSSAQSLGYTGIMSKEERNELLSLSEDKLYRKAIKSLFKKSKLLHGKKIVNALVKKSQPLTQPISNILNKHLSDVMEYKWRK